MRSHPSQSPVPSRRWLLAITLVLGLGLPALTAATGQPRTALVIGNGAYDEAPLKNPPNDARAMRDKLQELGFAVIYREDAGRGEMLGAAREFGNRLKRQGGVGVVYYAGHGMQVRGANYLIPVGAGIEAEDEVPYQALPLDQILAKLESAGNPLNLVYLDACRNNPFARSFRSATRGLARTGELAPTGTKIYYAARPNQVAQDGPGTNGTFTRHLLTALDRPGLSLTEVFQHTARGVIEETGESQVPWEEGMVLGRFVFRPSGEPPPRRPFEPEMIELPGGSFEMGCGQGESGCSDDEKPRHRVQIQPFAIGKYEVTQGQWRAVMGENPARFQEGDDYPVENVSWEDAKTYIERLNGKTGKRYRLPSEAEWEYAARAGTIAPFSTGDCIHTDQANYDGSYDYNDCGAKTGVYRSKTVAVGSLPANPWGLHEVHGNVWEWVEDCRNGSYEGAPSDGRAWTSGNCDLRVLRGGSWDDGPRDLRSADRDSDGPAGRSVDIGFRLAQDL